MSKDVPVITPKGIADPAYSTRPEGEAAHEAGVQFRDCPYIRGEDRWAWEQGWIAAEHAHRQRIAAMP